MTIYTCLGQWTWMKHFFVLWLVASLIMFLLVTRYLPWIFCFQVHVAFGGCCHLYTHRAFQVLECGAGAKCQVPMEYPPWNEHSSWTSHFPGKYHQDGGFSMAMLVYRSVTSINGLQQMTISEVLIAGVVEPYFWWFRNPGITSWGL